MEKITKVSIIIPIYNTGDKLVRCLESVLNQTHDDFECLLVDDGSIDQSPRIIDEFAAKDSRFKAIHKPNGGVSSARNEGLRIADGEWVVFLDSDDTIKPNHIEAMLSVVEDGIDIVFTGFEQIVAGNQIVKGHAYDRQIYKGKDGIANFFDETEALNFMIPWDRMYRRSVIVKEGILFDTKLSLSEDRLFCYQYLLHTSGIATIPEITYLHDATDQNSLSNRFYPFSVNAYRHDTFVDATEKLQSAYTFPDHAIFLLWKYTWDLMVQTLSSLHGIKKNVFKISRLQKDFFHNHFGWKLYDMAHRTSEVKDFTQSNLFQVIYNEKFIKWNLTRLIEFILYKLHIKR